MNGSGVLVPSDSITLTASVVGSKLNVASTGRGKLSVNAPWSAPS